ncbi:MAG TPA: carboxypeptidase regulatory-like domain-containing protein [Phycisphaerae bacterium]|nr:carboxypeptidase regulatory-like domain-containing protein [Phycisphaerales bacterium]HRX84449.1 carboxypeptidase regulatory-like domain-containing protein [Phycisphaerae bacterium]
MKLRSQLVVMGSAMLILAAVPTIARAEGKLKATVKKAGERPRRLVIDMAADPNCIKAHTEADGKVKKVGTENALVSKEGEVMNAIVYVKDGLGDKEYPAPSEKKTLEQKGCMYDPHVLTIQVGQPLTVINDDETLHNIHSFAKKQRAFNFAQPQKGMEKDVDFQREEFVLVKCDVHPWMSAHIGVFNHPFSAITDKSGAATIENLPPGEYTIGVWHEEFGEKEQKVTIKDGEEATVEFTFE